VTSFIPALIAVLLVETGGRSVVFARLPRLSLAATVLGLAVGVSAVAGFALAPTMTAHARALLLGIALMLTATDQLGTAASPEPPATVRATLVLVWRCSPAFLAFAFSTWKADPFGAAAGALAGFAGAVVLGPVVPSAWVRRIKVSAITITALFGLYLALWALRLVA
jgi:hypothetical protein